MSLKKINVKKPFLLNDEYFMFFENKETYYCKPSMIKNIKHAFISEQGLVMKNGLLIDRCAFNLKGNKDNTFYFSFWKQLFEEYLVCKYGKSLPYVKFSKQSPVLLVHTKWFNYAFWITDSLVRLWLAYEKQITKKVKLIIPENLYQFSFVRESLELFDVDLELVPEGHHVFADELVLPETRRWSANFYPAHIKETKKYILSKIPDVNIKYAELVYISRSKRGVRGLENEEELISALTNLGFEVFYMEEHTFFDQINIIRNAKITVSTHGAGLANIMFMKERSLVIEIMDYEFADYKNPMPYWKLASAVGVNYSISISKTESILKKKRLTESNSEWRMKLVNKSLSANVQEILTIINEFNK